MRRVPRHSNDPLETRGNAAEGRGAKRTPSDVVSPFRYTSFPTLFSFFEPWRYARVHLPQSYAIAIPDRKVNLRRAHFARRSSYLLVMYVMYCESLMFPETSSLSPRIVIVPYREGNASWTSLFLRVLRFLSPFSHLPEIRTRHRFSPRIASARFYR